MTFKTRYEQAQRTLWGYLSPDNVASFTMDFLGALSAHDGALKQNAGHILKDGVREPVHFYIWASASQKYFSLGGDLAYFIRRVKSGDRAGLNDYANRCVECVYMRLNHYFADDLITLSLVQGDAFGGGFECALSSHVIIAEEHARFGFPEIRFNSFPGMGACSLLKRRVSQPVAERLLLCGERYSATAMLELGLVDIVVPKGRGICAVRDYVQSTSARRHGTAAIYRARQAVSPISRDELMSITHDWVDTALKLEDKDLRLMAQLVSRQKKSLR
ncbi:MAG: crotonase/enoyl-CoA hydratase family protein [Pseudomonas sp.]|uniref:crotonase/enoyl-CoA hydratase family protein n=1 Tax=Pseudomonas sp. TaxID=306 RepID=UPI00239A5D74|nr:crotonase/enoyl-CoA hydratase family protein [Pseudomonas sp.]MDE1193993.1 crotonase/enoyl-CoA hydratase family protein [Pseudomonas sp.]